MIYRVSRIAYDTDGEQVQNLPKSFLLSADDEDGLADAISDATGFCVKSFTSEQITLGERPPFIETDRHRRVAHQRLQVAIGIHNYVALLAHGARLLVSADPSLSVQVKGASGHVYTVFGCRQATIDLRLFFSVKRDKDVVELRLLKRGTHVSLT